MRIKEVSFSPMHYVLVEHPNGRNVEYRRMSFNVWERLYGSSWDAVVSTEEDSLDKLYEEYMLYKVEEDDED